MHRKYFSLLEMHVYKQVPVLGICLNVPVLERSMLFKLV